MEKNEYYIYIEYMLLEKDPIFQCIFEKYTTDFQLH